MCLLKMIWKRIITVVVEDDDVVLLCSFVMHEYNTVK